MEQVHSRENNFDLIRLLAAIQVMMFHCYEHLGYSSAILNKAAYGLRFFSGVPIFFVVSGFLIFATYDRQPKLADYARNRFLRIYPGLWGCLLFTILLLGVCEFINPSNILSKPFWAWLATQVSFLQFYTPDMLRGFGVGNPNGSLWTIPVEIGFYVAVPIIFFAAGKKQSERNVWLLILIVLSVAYNIFYQQYKFGENKSTFVKLMGVNLMPYLFYFLLGAMAYVNRNRIDRWIKGKALIWLTIYIAYCAVFAVWLKKFDLTYWTGPYHFIAIVLLAGTVISTAFSGNTLSKKMLLGYDISYGIYLYHMPVINLMLVFMNGNNNTRPINDDSIAWVVMAATIVLAFLSWIFVEKPALALKRKTMRDEGVAIN